MRAFERLLGPAALVLTAIAIVRWRAAIPDDSAMPAERPVVQRAPVSLSDSALADAEIATVQNDPFRLSNSPSTVLYDPESEMRPGGPRATPRPRVRPTLVLRAIVGGPPWQAVVDGLPSQPPGTVVHAGSAFDRLVVRLVTRDSVVIQGADTTWILAFGRHQ